MASWYPFYNNLPANYFLIAKWCSGRCNDFIYPHDKVTYPQSKQQFTEMKYNCLLCNSLVCSKDIADDGSSKSDGHIKENKICSVFEAWWCFKNLKFGESLGFYTKDVVSGGNKISRIKIKNQNIVYKVLRFLVSYVGKAMKSGWSQLTIHNGIVDMSTVNIFFCSRVQSAEVGSS